MEKTLYQQLQQAEIRLFKEVNRILGFDCEKENIQSIKDLESAGGKEWKWKANKVSWDFNDSIFVFLKEGESWMEKEQLDQISNLGFKNITEFNARGDEERSTYHGNIQRVRIAEHWRTEKSGNELMIATSLELLGEL